MRRRAHRDRVGLAAVGLCLTLATGCDCSDRAVGEASLARIGEPAEMSLGLAMPSGTRRIHHEVPYAGSSDELEELLSADETEAVSRHFRALPGSTEGPSSTFTVVDAWTVRVEPLREIPRSGSGSPLLSELPAGVPTHITVHRHGTPGPCPPCPEGFHGPTIEGCRCP